MTLKLALCFFPILVGAVPTPEALSETPSVAVQIKSPKRDYLRGEPVLVTVTITNDGEKDFPAWIDRVKYAISFFIKGDGEKFLKVNVDASDNVKLDRYVDPLAEGKSKSYDFRILPIYAGGKASALAFDKPGTYNLKVRYPLFKKSEVKFESNAIQLRIHKPKGVDAKAWAEMDRPHFLRFLQSGVALRDNGEYPPVTAARLIMKYPSSNYRPALHWALSDFTRRRPGWFNFKHLKAADVKLIKEALAAGGKVETSHISPAVGVATALLIASAVTILLLRKRLRAGHPMKRTMREHSEGDEHVL